jgi:hypothetical protein
MSLRGVSLRTTRQSHVRSPLLHKRSPRRMNGLAMTKGLTNHSVASLAVVEYMLAVAVSVVVAQEVGMAVVGLNREHHRLEDFFF